MTKVACWPRLRPQVDFPDGPWTYPPSWTELTDYLRDDSEIQVRRGRTNEFSKFSAGTLDGMTLENATRVFDSSYTSAPAPFAGNISPSKQLQLMVEYPWLPGQLPDGVSRNTQVSSPSNLTVTLDNTTGFIKGNNGYQSIKAVGTSTSAGSFMVTTGLPISPGQPLMTNMRYINPRSGVLLTITFWWRNGAGAVISNTTTSVVTPTPTGTWQQLITSNNIVAPASTVTVDVQITTNNLVVGEVWRYDAIVVDYVSVYNYVSLMYSYVDDWGLEYSGRDAVCKVRASDAFASFGVKDIVSTGYEDTVLALSNLRHYWSMGQPSSWSLPYITEDGPGTAQAQLKNFTAFGVPGPVLTDLTTALGLTQDATNVAGGWLDFGAGTIQPLAGVAWSVGWWFQMRSQTDRMLEIGPANDAGSYSAGQTNSNFIDFYANSVPAAPNGINVAMNFTNASGASTGFSVGVTPPAIKALGPNGLWNGTFINGSAYDGAWHFLVMVVSADHKTYSFYIDGQKVTPAIVGGSGTGNGTAVGTDVQTQPNTITPAFGTSIKALFGWSPVNPGSAWTGQVANFMVVDRALTGAEISNLYNIAQNQWFGQTPGSRMNAVLDVLKYPSAMRNIDTGNSTFNAETNSLAQTNSLEYMQYVEDSENGWYFIDKWGNTRLIGRVSMIKPPGNQPKWVIGDQFPTNYTTELPLFGEAKLSNSNENIYTEGEGSRQNGSTLYVFGTNVVTQGKRTISMSNLLNASDSEVLNILNYRVQQYQDPALRIDQIVIQPEGTDELWQFVLNVDIGDVIQINLRPPPTGSNVNTVLGRVQQVTHSIGRRRWKCVVNLASVDVQNYFILDNATLGKLDVGNKVSY